MSRSQIAAMVETDADKGQSLAGKVSTANWEMIDTALRGELIESLAVPSSKGTMTQLYRARQTSGGGSVEGGAAIDARDASGETALIIAAEAGDVGRMRGLLDRGANPTAASYSGWTALHGAAECGSVEAIRLLAEAGVNLSPRANSGKTPVDIARQYERPAAAEALAALGGEANVSAEEEAVVVGADAEEFDAALALEIEALDQEEKLAKAKADMEAREELARLVLQDLAGEAEREE